MVRRFFLLALVMLSWCTQAVAQTFPKPPDVAAFSQKAPTLDTSGTPNTVIDSTVTPMPVTQLTNIAIPSTSGRIQTITDQTESKITGSISGTTLNMTGLTSGPAPRNGDFVYGAGIGLEGAQAITAIVSAWNGTSGTYTVQNSMSISSEALVSTPNIYCLSTGYGGPCGENKFRTLVDFSHMLPDDPMRNFGQPTLSHLHCFFGNGTTNAYSVYASLRTHALSSTAAGTDANGTGYWHPCMIVKNPYGDGVDFAIRPNFYTVYYTENPASDGTGANAKAFIPRGLRYVFSFDMDATWDSVNNKPVQYAWLQSYLDAANASQTYTRYSLTNPSNGQYLSQAQYACIGATPSEVTTIVSYDISGNPVDPFNGTCEHAVFTGSASASLLTVTAITSGTIKLNELLTGAGIIDGPTIISQASGTTGGVGTYNLSGPLTVSSQTLDASQEFYITLTSARCYDGTNLWSPGAYKHVISGIWDTVTGTWTCPSNYYKIPAFTLEVHYTQYGWADRQRWDLSSDISFRSKFGLTKQQLPPGTTFHTDWMNGWDDVQMRKWETNCLGVEHAEGHQCNSSQMDATEYFKGGYAGEGGVSRSPQVDLNANSRSVETDHGWMPIPATWSAALVNMKMTSMNDNMPPAANSNQLAGVVPINFDLRAVGR